MEENVKAYKSPRRKLVKFFKSSRDQWKIKCRAAKRLIKRLKKRMLYLEAKKDGWEKRARALEEQVEDLKKSLRHKKSKQMI